MDRMVTKDAQQQRASLAPSSKKARKPRVVSGVYNTNVSIAPGCASDDENVIMKLSIMDPAAGSAQAISQPNPYNESASTFVSHPYVVGSVPEIPDARRTDAHDVQALTSAALGPLGAMIERPYDMTVYAAPPGLNSSDAHQDAAVHADTTPPADAALSHSATAPGSVAGKLMSNAPSGKRLVRLLREFEEKCKGGEWPCSTSVHCYWCCHRFPNVPLGLPVRLSNGMFHVMGCFCSLECASAFNFNSKESNDECLNRYSLINALAQRLGLGASVKPAPSRLALKMFGGPLTIEQFRAMGTTDKQFVINTPPMQTVTQQIEEVHDSDMRGEYKYIPLDNDRVSKYQEKVRLRRTKPLIDFKNTLDHSMKLKIGVRQAATAGPASAQPVPAL